MPHESDCHRCYYSQTLATQDPFYQKAVKPYTWLAAFFLFLSYVIGLLFTLRTHAAVIWSSDSDEKKTIDMSTSQLSGNGPFDTHSHNITRQGTSTSVAKTDIRNSQLYKRIVGQSYQEIGLGPNGENMDQGQSVLESRTPHVVPPKDTDQRHHSPGFQFQGLSEEDSQSLVRQITEIAATTSAIATRDATKAPLKAAHSANVAAKKNADRPHHSRNPTFTAEAEENPQGHASGGHDAPNWSRAKSAIVLLTATIAYAVIAEILVSTVDAVSDNVDEKFLGITLFALVPNTTEFLVSPTLEILCHTPLC
jgi:Ca2+:H+ antiporter